MLLTLNEDCLRLICNELDVQSQISLAFTCKYLRYIVKITYRTPKGIGISPALWPYLYANEEHFEVFFDCVGTNLTHLQLEGLSGRKLHLLQKIRVPKLKIFTLSLSRVIDLHGAFKVKEHFYNLMSSMTENLEQLLLQGISHEMLASIQDLKFPKLKRCGLLLRRVSCETGNQHEADWIAKMFPKLEHLLLLTDNVGHNMWLLKNLTELNLINCYNFVSEHLTQIFKMLPLKKFAFKPFDGIGCYEDEDYFRSIADCQTLEELHVEYHHLRQLANEWPKLKRLRSLTFTPKESCFCHYKPESFLMQIAQNFGHAMDTLVFKNIPLDMIHEDYLPFLESMTNLRCLIFVESFPKNLFLKLIAQSATGAALEEFRYIGLRDKCELGEGLKELLTHCRKLKTFDVSNGKADINFLREAIDLVAQQQRVWLEPFVFHCHNTEIKEQDLKSLILPNFIKVSFKRQGIEHSGVETIHCEWKI